MSYLGLMAVDDTRWGQWQSAPEFCACAETTTDSWKIQDQVPKNLYFCIAVAKFNLATFMVASPV